MDKTNANNTRFEDALDSVNGRIDALVAKINGLSERIDGIAPCGKTVDKAKTTPKVDQPYVVGRIGLAAATVPFRHEDPDQEVEDRILHFDRGWYPSEWDAILPLHDSREEIRQCVGCGKDVRTNLVCLACELEEGKIRVGDVIAVPYYGNGEMGAYTDEPMRFLPFTVVETEGATATLHCRFALSSRMMTKRCAFEDAPSFPKFGFPLSEALDFCETLPGRLSRGFQDLIVSQDRDFGNCCGKIANRPIRAWIANLDELRRWYEEPLNKPLTERRMQRRLFDAWEFGNVRWWVDGGRADGASCRAPVVGRDGSVATEVLTERCGVVPAITISA